MKSILYITLLRHPSDSKLSLRMKKAVPFITFEGLVLDLKEASILTVTKVLYIEQDNLYLARVRNNFDADHFAKNHKALLKYGWSDVDKMNHNEDFLYTL